MVVVTAGNGPGGYFKRTFPAIGRDAVEFSARVEYKPAAIGSPVGGFYQVREGSDHPLLIGVYVDDRQMTDCFILLGSHRQYQKQ